MSREYENLHPTVLQELRARRRQRPGAALDLFEATDAATVAWRREQAEVDADIAGLARDDGATALMAEMDRAGVPVDEQISRLKSYFARRDRLAAE